MSISTEGQTLGPDSTVSLVRKILDKIKYSKGFNLSTCYPTGGRPVPLPAAYPQNWSAIGTRITVPETTYLRGAMKFKAIVAFFSEADAVNLMFALYRYDGLVGNMPTCSLITSTPIVSLERAGWVEPSATLSNTVELIPGDTYYLTLFYNAGGIGVLGNSGILIDHAPYLSFVSSELGELTGPPDTLLMSTETVNNIYGSIYSVNQIAITK